MVRVANRVVARERVPSEWIGVGVVEGASPRIEGHAPLASAGSDAAHQAVPLPAVARVGFGAAEPVVEAVDQAVDRVLGVRDPVHAGLEHLDLVGDPVVVGVLGEHQHGRRDDQQAPAGGLDRARQDEVGQEVVADIHLPVAVRVLEPGHAADGLGLSIGVRIAHVAAHLADPQPTALVEDDLDGVHHQRLLGHELGHQARLQREGLTLRGRAQDGRGRDHQVLGQGCLHLAVAVAVLGKDGPGEQAEGDEGSSGKQRAHGTALIMGHGRGGARRPRASGSPGPTQPRLTAPEARATLRRAPIRGAPMLAIRRAPRPRQGRRSAARARSRAGPGPPPRGSSRPPPPGGSRGGASPDDGPAPQRASPYG